MIDLTKIIIITYCTVLGTILGSFSSMLIHRLHFDESGILFGRSKCPKCQSVLRWFNLIPIFSWIKQKGKCYFCKEKIPKKYPTIEIVFGVLFGLFAERFFGTTLIIPMLISLFVLMILFFYDLWYMEVDERIVLPAILLAICWSFFRELNFQEYLIGGAVGFFFYSIQYTLSKGAWVGAGDMRLGALLGFLLGWKMLLLCLFVAYILGSLIGLWLVLFKNYGRKSALPMGAFLMPSGILFLYRGNELLSFYLQFLGFPS